MADARQSHNVAGGHIAGRDVNIISTTTISSVVLEELQQLYEKLKQNPGGDASDGSFCEKLEHYLSARTKGDVRGLEQKLQDSGRLDQLDDAVEKKERATKSIMRHQASKTAQRIYVIVLDELHANFSLMVTPMVQAGEGRVAVDERILHMLENVRAKLGENFLEFTISDLLALLFFLGGNCHIRLDKC